MESCRTNVGAELCDVAELDILRIDSIDALAALSEEWRAIDAGIFPRTPFTSPSWNLLWWKHLARRRPAIYDRLFSHVVRCRGRLIAIAPMMLTHAPGRGLWRTRKLQFFGADPNLTEVRGLVTRPAHEAVVVEALDRHLDVHSKEWDWFEWSGLREGATAAHGLETSRGFERSALQRDFFLRLPADWAAFKSSRSRNIKESLRKCYNSLKRDRHEFIFRVNQNPAAVTGALERFFPLHRARSELRSTVSHADHFARDNSRQFIFEYALQPAQYNPLYVFELEIAGRVVASRLGFALGGELYLYYSGYLPEWGRYSVMTTLVAESIRWAIDNRFALVNLSTGDDESKRRWSPDEQAYSSLVRVGPSVRNRLAHGLYHRSSRQRRA